MQLRRLSAAVLVLALTGAAGCATSSSVASGDTLRVQINVDNNLQGITGVTVYLLTDTGSRRSLGPLESGDRRAYARSLRAGDYQLVATRINADEILSERFRVDSDNLIVNWALSQNQLTFATGTGN